MKILIALHKCMDLGGIINHTEQLIGGLKDIGHEVDLKEMVWAFNAYDQRKEAAWEIGPSGIPYHQGKGWNFKRHQRIPYRSAHLSGARQIMSEYDMIIWSVPVPSKNRDNLGNDDWPMLYDLPSHIRQVAFIHDGNAVKGSGHLLAVQERLHGIACVHPCALNGAAFVDVPRALVVNPQFNPVRKLDAWDDKQQGFINMQTFKAWKHVHELVEAIAYMPPRQQHELREIAGKGIEYQYMTSEDKCKDHYFHTDGEKFWDTALDNGLIHHDYWNTEEAASFLQIARVLVDPSWSNNYSKIGGHFNRVVVEAMIHGCIPIARHKGMGDELFMAGHHYVEIPERADAQDYADVILDTSHMSRAQAHEFRSNARLILPDFDRKIVAQRLIDLAHGDVAVEYEQGTASSALKSKVEDKCFDHFGVLI